MAKKSTRVAKKKSDQLGKASVKAAQIIAARARLRDVFLQSIAAVSAVEDRTDPPRVFGLDITNSTQVTKVTPTGKPAHQRLAVDITFDITIRQKKEDVEPTVSLSITFRARYDLSGIKKLVETQVVSFAAINAMAVVWPYISEVATSTTTKMGLPGLRLPSPPSDAGEIELKRAID